MNFGTEFGSIWWFVTDMYCLLCFSTHFLDIKKLHWINVDLHNIHSLLDVLSVHMIFYLNLQISLIMCSALITYEIGGRYEIIFYLICFLHKEIHTIAEIMGGKTYWYKFPFLWKFGLENMYVFANSKLEIVGIHRIYTIRNLYLA